MEDAVRQIKAGAEKDTLDQQLKLRKGLRQAFDEAERVLLDSYRSFIQVYPYPLTKNDAILLSNCELLNVIADRLFSVETQIMEILLGSADCSATMTKDIMEDVKSSRSAGLNKTDPTNSTRTRVYDAYLSHRLPQPCFSNRKQRPLSEHDLFKPPARKNSTTYNITPCLMEVEVRLTRTGEETWGFRLIGGTDFNMPLTVVKVLPDSPADLACLHNGDTVARIQGADAKIMTHDGAKAAVAAAEETLTLGVVRCGLYDLTLDDYDPIDEPLDQDDFDQPSHPTEVFQIQQFGDSPQDSKDSSRSRTGSRGNLDRRSISETRYPELTFNERSLTESPFQLTTKPYRPFSTEPSPIPPLEKPILLNPNYHDEFGKFHDGLDVPTDLPKVDEFAGLLSEQSRYKLPISKQYDPDGTKLKKTQEITTVVKTVEEKVVTEEITTKEVKVTTVEEIFVNEQKEEVQVEKMKKEVDLDQVEMTATSIVNESIEKAVTVADVIKKEMDLELSALTLESKTSSAEMQTTVTNTAKKETFKEMSEVTEITDKTSDVCIKEKNVSVSKEVAKFENDDKQIVVDERKEFMKQEIEETIESGSVRRKSDVFRKDVKMTDVKVEKKAIDECIESGSVRSKSELFSSDVKKDALKVDSKFIDEFIESGSVRRKSEIYNNNVETKSQESAKIESRQSKILSDQNDVKEVEQSSQIRTKKLSSTTESVQKSDERKTEEAKYSTAKLLAEQRAYTIGLQTIPHIRAEPGLSKPLETKPDVKKEGTEVTRVERGVVSKETTGKSCTADRKKTERVGIEETHIPDKKERVEKVESVIKQDHIREVKQQEYTDYVEIIKSENEKREKIMLSGAEMAQLSEKRSGELITKMDEVITEYQTKAGLEEEMIMQRERRSRSRSKVEDEVVKDVEPKTKEITEIKTTSTVLESTETKSGTRHESMENKRESRHETMEAGSKDGCNSYISICEAHVYTNKNSIFDDVAESSETATVESITETNIALEANEAMVTERVAIDSKTKQEDVQIFESSEAATVKTEEAIIEEKKDFVQELDVQESFIEIERKKTTDFEIVETKEPIIELHEDIVEKAVKVEIENKMEIQEIETSKYIEELDVVKESIKIVETEDVQVLEQSQRDQVFEEISVKAFEDISINKEKEIVIDKKEVIQDTKVSQEEIISLKEDTIVAPQVKEEAKEVEEEVISIKKEDGVVLDDIKLAEETVVVKDLTEKSLEMKDEYAQLKVTKEEITELQKHIEINQEIEVNIKKSVHISESDNTYQSFISESSIQNGEYIQESSFTARSTENSFASSVQESTFVARSTEDARKHLTLDLESNIKKSDSQSSVKSTISTPTPSTVPPTPLTDEYVFRLQMPLPKLTGPPVPRSPSPQDEDPHIVKKKMVPHIDTEIIEEVVYETPLPTPPEDKSSPPRFSKPGLKGGNMRYMFPKEEIKEIERKSSLLASAIDQTIKSIEEYKEEVGIENNIEDPVIYNGYGKVVDTKVFKDKLDEVNIERQIVKNTESINKIVESRNFAQDTVNRVNLNGIPARVTVNVENNVTNNVAEVMDQSVEAVNVEGYRPVPFNPDDAPHLERVEIRIPGPTPTLDPGKAFVLENGEIMGTHQGIVDGLEEAVVDDEVAKDLGKPGMTDEKIAELISGESEMLREAHVMGLTRVLKSHMHRDNDDSSVDFKKIKPIVESLKDSEVLKALNEEFVKTQEEKKKEERKWTKFLQKPARPVPKAKFGYHGWTANDDEVIESPYKVKIVKQPKPKVAPDYKPQDFNTGPLPWEERAQNEPPPPPVEPETPILIPEDTPVFLEAIDNLPETAVPDLEETGIPLPPEPIETPKSEPEPEVPEEEVREVEETKQEEPAVEENSNSESEMENRVAEQLIKNVEGMVDPNAPLEQQLAQMRAQLAALAQLPGVIQQTLELVTRQLCQITQQEAQSHRTVTQQQMAIESSETIEESNESSETIIEDVTEETREESQIEEVVENGVTEEVQQTQTKEMKQIMEKKETRQTMEIKKEVRQVNGTAEEMEKMKREEQEILEEQRRIEKQKKELSDDMLEQESEEMKESPHEIALRFINELLGSLLLDKEPKDMKQRSSFALVPNGLEGEGKEKAMAKPQREVESEPKQLNRKQSSVSNATKEDKKEYIRKRSSAIRREIAAWNKIWPWGDVKKGIRQYRVNFMKYEKPPITTDHLKNSEVYKMIHNMEQEPVKRVELLTPVIAEADYRELPAKLEYLNASEVYKLLRDEELEPLRGVKMLSYIIAEEREKCRSVTPSADMTR